MISSKLKRENVLGFQPKHEIFHRSFFTAIPAAGTFVLNSYKYGTLNRRDQFLPHATGCAACVSCPSQADPLQSKYTPIFSLKGKF